MSRTKKTSGRSGTYPMLPMPRDPGLNLGFTRSSSMNLVNEATKLNTRLIESIPDGDIANMERLIRMGANPNATCRLYHVSACHIAAMHDNDALELLLRSGADGSRSDKAHRTPLHCAAWAGNAKQIALLLNPPEALRYGLRRCDLHAVMQYRKKNIPENNLEIIPSKSYEEPTLSNGWCDGLEHNCRNVMKQLPPFKPGWTALHAASARAQHHCVQLLLAAGADACGQPSIYMTPLDVAGNAHYMAHKIDVNNLMKTVDLLLKAGGKFRKNRSGFPLVTCPLDTAVELESAAAVEQMLQSGASAKQNSQGLTAMHICVKKRNKELLQLLANHKCNSDDALATVDVKDGLGSTVLCAAVKAEWIQGVRIALDAGASIILKEYEESPFHIAIKLGNIDILEMILNIAKNNNIDYCNVVRETALFEAISHNHLDVLKFLLKHGSKIEVENSDDANVFHVATKYGRKEILEYLLKYDCNITKRLINRSDCCGPPLYYAINNNHPDCAELLISEGTQVNAKYYATRSTLYPMTVLHIAAKMNHCEIAEMIIKKDATTIHASVYELGWTPLHEACEYGNKEMIKLLLRNGADLSGGENVNESNYFAKQRNIVPIKLLMSSVSKPTEYLEEIFDSYITREDRESTYEVKVDHRVLLPRTGKKHMGVIKALINTGNSYNQHRLLLHPLVQSFLYTKWRSLLPFFYSVMALHVCFVLSLNVFALSLFWYKDRKIEPLPSMFRSCVWIYLIIIYLTACLLTIQEIIVINMKNKRYFLCLEMLVKWLSITLAVILPQVVSWDSKPNPEWVRLTGSAALLLTWVRTMFLLSRLPDYGYYVLMYGKVATKVFKVLVSFGFLIFGFSVSFMIQFHGQPPFEDPWSSLLMTMVMMTSEFGYNDKINVQSVEHATASLIMKRLIFVSFLILVSIILMNLLVGVAVNDVNSLEIIGNIKRLEKQVEFIASFEDIGCNNFIKKILPTFLYRKWFKIMEWHSRFFLLYSHPYERNYGHRLPSRLREAIFEKANIQKKQSDDDRGTVLYQMKLDEIHTVIVKKHGTEPPKSESPDNALMMKLDEILTVIAQKDGTEPPKSEGPDNALMMKLDEIHKVIAKKDGTEPPKSEGPDNALMMKLDEIHKVIAKKDGTEPPKSEGPDNALMMKLDEIYKVVVKNDSVEPTTAERLASLDTAIHKIFEEILNLRNKFETN